MLYTTADGNTRLEVKLDKETVWLTQSQMAELFGRDRSVITRHIRNIFKEGELDESLVCAKNAQPKNYGRREGHTQLTETTFYNLDVIITVGYRVKSQQGVQFRQWASALIKEYLIKGYDIDQRRLDHDDNLKSAERLMSRALTPPDPITNDEYAGLFHVITDYVYVLDTLDRYDYQTLEITQTTRDEPFRANYDNAMDAINALKEKIGCCRWFANEKDESFKSSIGQIYQTFGGVDLYPSVEEKAAMLLHLVIKNHSYSDGNKRIVAMLFLWFMEKKWYTILNGWT